MISGVVRLLQSSLGRSPALRTLPRFSSAVKFTQVRTMSSSKSQFVFPDDQPLVCLDASSAWGHLTRDEQLYSHYLSQASWWGGLAVLLQTSPESPDIFRSVLMQ